MASIREHKGLSPGDAAELELKAAFCHFDKNGDGKISVDELGPVMRVLGQNPTEANVKALMKKADKDCTGFIEYDEYVALIKEHTIDQDTIKLELRQAFLYFDKQKKGKINMEELRNCLMSLGEPLTYKEADSVLRMADQDGDGFLNVEEFVEFLCKRI